MSDAGTKETLYTHSKTAKKTCYIMERIKYV